MDQLALRVKAKTKSRWIEVPEEDIRRFHATNRQRWELYAGRDVRELWPSPIDWSKPFPIYERLGCGCGENEQTDYNDVSMQ